MKLKLDESGHVVVHEGMPVYIRDDGQDMPFNAPHAIGKISQLNGEAMGHRQAKEELEARFKPYEGLDPEKARQALDIVSNIDAKKLVDAGEVDRVRKEISSELSASYEVKLTEANKKVEVLEGRIQNLVIGGKFAQSKYIKDCVAVPEDMVRATFGRHFMVDGDDVVCMDGDKPIYSQKHPGEKAGFDEALEILISRYPHKDNILKPATQSGPGGSPSPRASTAMKRSEMSSKQRHEFIKTHGQEAFLKLPR